MFSKASAAAAENVPGEERRRSRIQVLPLEVVVVLVGQAPKLTRKKRCQPRNGALWCCRAGQAALTLKLVLLVFYWSLLDCVASWNPKSAHKLLHGLYCKWYHVYFWIHSTLEGHRARFPCLTQNRTSVELLCADPELRLELRKTHGR